MIVMPNLFPPSSTFQVPNDSMFAAEILKARVEFVEEALRLIRDLHRPRMGTLGASLARTGVKIAEIESRYSTLIYCAIDEKLTKAD